MTQNPLPANLPKDTTPRTHTGTLNTAYLLDRDQATLTDIVITVGTAAAAAATSITVTALPAPLPKNTVLDFGGVLATLTAAAEAGATALTVSALSGAIPKNATARYQNFDEIPLAENFNATLNDDEESIKVHGRATPIRSMNGKDFTATVKTVAGIDDPVVAKLVAKGMQLSPACEARLVFKWSDGFALLVTVNIGAPKPSGNPGQANRYDFSANLSGDVYWTNLNDTTPTWQKVGALTA